MRAKVLASKALQKVGESWAWMLCLGLLAVLVFLGTSSPLLGAVTVGFAAIFALIVCLDLERAGFVFITLAMFGAPLNNLRVSSGSYVTGSDLLFVLGIGVLAPTIVRNRVRLPALFVLGLLILLSMGIVASVASTMPLVSANQVARLVIGAFALPIFFMMWHPAPKIIARLAGAYVLGTVFSVGYGLLKGPVIGDPRYVGFTYHPNFFGLECLLAAALVPYIMGMIDQRYRWVFAGSWVICAFGVYLSGSRAALLVLIMLIGIYPFVERSVKAGAAVFAGIIGVLAFAGQLLNSDGNNALARLFGGGSASGSDIQRQELAGGALKALRAHPFLGNGFDGSIGAHDIYLQVAVAVGIFGLVGYLLILWCAARTLFWTGVDHRLAYPVLAYVAIGPLTNILWDRLIWSVLALAFTVAVRGPQSQDPDTADEPLAVLSEIRNPG